MTYKELTEKFLCFEKQNMLLSLNIKDLYVWEIARTIVFFRLVDHYFPSNPPDKKKSLWRHVTDILHRILINSIFFNPYLTFKRSEVLIFESGRKYNNDDGNFIDIYTNYLDADLERKNISFTRYETLYLVDDRFYKRKFETKHIDFILLASKFFKKINKLKFTPTELDKINLLTNNLKKEFGISLDIKSIFKNEIGRFKAEYRQYSKLFNKKRPKEIYIINSCDKSALIAAALHQSITVNELQHGLNSNYDVVLNFPYSSPGDLHYFPDNFYIWNNVDMFFASLPLVKKNIKYFKNTHIENWINKTKTLVKDSLTILIISQPYGSILIRQYILNNIVDLPEYNFIYKIHPAEGAEEIEKFKKSINQPNLRFVSNEESTYSLMKKAQFVIGVYSSVVFEAEPFGCKILLLDLPGVEMSMPLVEKGLAKKCKMDEKLFEVIKHYS